MGDRYVEPVYSEVLKPAQNNYQNISKIVKTREIPLCEANGFKLSEFVPKDSLYNQGRGENKSPVPIQPSINKKVELTDKKPELLIEFLPSNPNSDTLNIEKFIKLLAKNINTKLSTQIQELSNKHANLAPFNCKTCKNFKAEVELECKHSACMFCLQQNVRKLIANPDIESLKRCRCSTCLILCTANDLIKILDSNTISQFIGLHIARTCGFCKRSLNACTEFYSEQRCMHLCSVCYSNELFMGSKSCMVCEIPFDKRSVTMSRIGICSSCKCSNKIVTKFLRYIHSDHLHCYDCLVEVVKSKKCQVCSMDLKFEYNLLSNYFQKTCPECTKTKGIVEFKVCNNCEAIVCEQCYSEMYCKKCRVFYN